jgi:hypothetical protein
VKTGRWFVKGEAHLSSRRVRLDLPASDLTTFMMNTDCKTSLVSISPKKYVPGDLAPDWWYPNKATDLMECMGGNSYLLQHILVDCTNPQVFTVYVFSMTDNFATPTIGSK